MFYACFYFYCYTMKFYGIISIIFLNKIVSAQNWSYSRPDEWPGECQRGNRQSPININFKNTIMEMMRPIEYVNYDRDFVAVIENEGYTLALKFDNECCDKPSIRGSVIQSDYTLHNIHFHWAAEHTINNRRYPLEAHFVHYKTEAGNLTNALNFGDGVVVLAVLYELSEISNDVFDVITRTVDDVAHRVNQPVQLDAKISPESLLPENLDNFFAYQGSLTTPNCNEVVTWIVYSQPAEIEESQLEKLSDIYTEDDKRLVQNYRPLQAVNGRGVLYTRGNYI
ncbi:unnamed protein product [Phaedon cochleariae]|uniref:carbonic anhydrase n=1 Tax=Phaedon cochleariae TaxID=80249 RepID=A0A9P0DRQ4_PHACE|nr:unnamed protein product [Phaedon cochleariae]